MTNLCDLLVMQRKLDEQIIANHNIPDGVDLYRERLLALMVKLGKAANEQPQIYKYWGSKRDNKQTAEDELVDCMHYLLSLGNNIGVDGTERTAYVAQMAGGTRIDQLLELFGTVTHLQHNRTAIQWTHCMNLFMGFVTMCHMDWQLFVQAYVNKHHANYNSQQALERGSHE